ncbi:MAG: immunoglobulin-like domain-containing protein [Gemmatimonas sp.]
MNAATGCRSTTESFADANVSIRTRAEQASYDAGSQVLLRLDNNGSRPITLNLCADAVERLNGDKWVAVPLRGDCELLLLSLMPGEATENLVANLPIGLPNGNYRAVVSSIRDKESGAPVAPQRSDTFTVSSDS